MRFSLAVFRLLPLLTLFSLQAFSQDPIFDWVATFDCPTERVNISEMTTDDAGNVYTTGWFRGTSDFDPSSASSALNSTGLPYLDRYLCKHDADGALEWVFHCSTDDSNAVIPSSISADGNGNLFVAAGLIGTADLDFGSGTHLVSDDTVASLIMMLNTAGELQWARTINKSTTGPATSGISRIYVDDANGNLAVIGTVGDDTVDFAPGSAQDLMYAEKEDVFIARYTVGGAYSWASQFKQSGSTSSSGNVIAIDVEIDGFGNTYFTGYFRDSIDFDPGSGTLFLTSQNQQFSTFICKLNNLGGLVWAKKLDNLDTGGTYSRSTCLALDGLGNVLIGGRFSGTLDLNPGSALFSVTQVGAAHNAFQLKLTSSGNFAWGASLTGNNNMAVYDMQVDAAGAVYSTGNYRGTVDFDPGTGTTQLSMSSGYGTFVQKLSSNGDFEWAVTTANEVSGSMVGASGFSLSLVDQAMIVAGIYQERVDFDPGAGQAIRECDGNYNSTNIYDAFFMRLNDCVAPGVPSDVTPVENLTVCQGQATALSASGEGTLSWYDNATGGTYLGSGTSFQTGALNATTTFYVQDSLCQASDRIAIIVSVTQIDTGVTHGGIDLWQWLFAHQNGAQYQWFDCLNMTLIADADSQGFVVPLSGFYAVELTLGGCVDTSACYMVDIGSVGSISQLSTLEVYPNPVSDQLQLQSEHQLQNVRLVNSVGELVHTAGDVPAGVSVLPVVKLPAGVYTMLVEWKGMTYAQRVVVTR